MKVTYFGKDGVLVNTNAKASTEIQCIVGYKIEIQCVLSYMVAVRWPGLRQDVLVYHQKKIKNGAADPLRTCPAYLSLRKENIYLWGKMILCKYQALQL